MVEYSWFILGGARELGPRDVRVILIVLNIIMVTPVGKILLYCF